MVASLAGMLMDRDESVDSWMHPQLLQVRPHSAPGLDQLGDGKLSDQALRDARYELAVDVASLLDLTSGFSFRSHSTFGGSALP